MMGMVESTETDEFVSAFDNSSEDDQDNMIESLEKSLHDIEDVEKECSKMLDKATNKIIS